jgi:hypothetical protein
MAYNGRSLDRGNYLKLDSIKSQFNGVKKTFNLTIGGSPFFPGSAYGILVVLGGVIQEPESAYIVDQSQISFASAPGALDDFFCVALAVPVGIGVPADDTVSTSKLKDGSVTAAKLATGAVGGGGTWAIGATVGITTIKIVGIATTSVTGTATSEGALQTFGNVSVIDGILLTDQSIDASVSIPSGRNGLLVGPVTVGVGLTVDIASGSTLVIV